MAWNDPFETLVDSQIEELGIFLQQKRNLEVVEILQIQEICRDFCNFLCKDVQKATPRDYGVYLQLHALSSEDEQNYSVKLGYIQEFAQSVKPASESETVPPPNVPKDAEKPVSLEDRALLRERRATRSFDADQLRLDLLMMKDEDELKAPEPKESEFNVSPSSPKINALSSKELSRQELEKAAKATPKHAPKAVSPADGPTLNSGLIDPGTINIPSVSDSLDVLVNRAKSRVSQGSPKSMLEQFEDNYDTSGLGGDKNEFSDMGNFSLNQNASVAIPMESSAFQRISQEFEEEQRQKAASKPKSMPKEKAVSRPKRESQPKAEAVFSPASDGDSEGGLIRGVEGVNYNFSTQSIRKMREFEKKQAKNIQPVDTGEQLTGGFRPYLFDGKYLIDVQLPTHDGVTPVRVSALNRYLMPLAPAMIMLAVTALLLTISVPAGLVCLLIAALCVAGVISDILPAQQQTPQAVLTAYINARNGRCYGRAMSLLALSGDAAQPVDLHEAWEPENGWPEAIKKRFVPTPSPETRLVSCSPQKDAQLLLYTTGNNYYLVPMVRIDGKWFITDPKLPPHEMA